MSDITALRSRHLLGIADLEPAEISLILDTTVAMKEVGTRSIKKVPALRGRTVVNLFFEASTRTRLSFELAEKRLSADTMGMTTAGSSVVKGETLIDTAKTLEAMSPDMIVVRHASSGAAHVLARVCRSSIINAGDGTHEHPTQALLDAFTIRERKGRLSGLRVAIIGDLLHSRVLRSNALLLPRMGAEVIACGPSTLIPLGLDRMGVKTTSSIDEACDGADVVMMLRVQHERMHGMFLPSVREYFSLFGLTSERLARAKSDAIVMHPGPMNRGVEIASDVADGNQSVILDQVANGVAVRMAVLYLLAGGEAQGEGMKTLLKGGHVVDPVAGRNGQFDVLIDGDRIVKIASDIPLSALGAEKDAKVIDVPKGFLVTPGLIDMHVHLREPGQEHKETIATGLASAVAGGFTAVACMPNTSPVNDQAGITQFMLKRAAEVGLARVYPIGAVSMGSNGEQITEIGDLHQAGCVAITDDGKPVGSALLMRRALEYASMFKMPVIEHCEDPSLKGEGVAHEGAVASMLGLKGIPSCAESIMAERDISIAELTGGHVHIAHMSVRETLRAVRTGKERGIKVTCEVTPHHFTLTDEAIRGYDTNTKMNPPLREEADRLAMIDGLRDGSIDVIATDHAPHHADEKALEFDKAPFGIVGCETAIPLCVTRLIEPGVIGWPRLIELLSAAPARILNVPGGTLAEGGIADLTVIAPEAKVTIRAAELKSKSKNTPFDGWELRGAAAATIVGGKMVFVNDAVAGAERFR